jgi:hypothetical protein
MGGLICNGQDSGGHGGGEVDGLQESPPFMTTRPSHNIIHGFLKLTNKNSAAIGENLGRKKYLRLHVNMSVKQCRELLRMIIAESVKVVLNSNSAILVKVCIFHRKACSNRHKENNLSELCSQIYVIKLAYR